MQARPHTIRSHSQSKPTQLGPVEMMGFDHSSAGERWSAAGIVGYVGVLVGLLAFASAPQLVGAAIAGAIVARYAGWVICELREAIAGRYLRVRRARLQHDVVTGR